MKFVNTINMKFCWFEIFFISFLYFIGAVHAQNDTVWISPNGKESFCSQAKPCSLNTGFSKVSGKSKATIYFEDGTYDCIDANSIIINNEQLFLVGNSPTSVIITTSVTTLLSPIFTIKMNFSMILLEKICFQDTFRSTFGSSLGVQFKLNLSAVIFNRTHKNFFQEGSDFFLTQISFKNVNITKSFERLFAINNNVDLGLFVKKALVIDSNPTFITVFCDKCKIYGEIDDFYLEKVQSSQINGFFLYCGEIDLVFSNIHFISTASSNVFLQTRNDAKLRFEYCTFEFGQLGVSINVTVGGKLDLDLFKNEFNSNIHGTISIQGGNECNIQHNTNVFSMNTGRIVTFTCTTVNLIMNNDQYQGNSGGAYDSLFLFDKIETLNLIWNNVETTGGFFSSKMISIGYVTFSNITFNGCSFVNNFGRYGGVISIDHQQYQITSHTILSFIKCKITHNYGDFAGVLYYSSNEQLNCRLNILLKDCDVSDQKSDSNGGIFTVDKNNFNRNDLFTIDGGHYGNNSAKDCGGGFFMRNMNVFVMNSDFNNHLSNKNGAIFALFGGENYCFFNGSTFRNSHSYGSGGSHYFEFFSNIGFFNSILNNNFATGGGGSIFIDRSNQVILDERVRITQSNSNYGGGLFINSNGVLSIEATITGNTAGVGGGGVYFTNSSMKTSKIHSNFAQNGRDVLTFPRRIMVNNTLNKCNETKQNVYRCKLSSLTLFDNFNTLLFSNTFNDFELVISVVNSKVRLNQRKTKEIIFEVYIPVHEIKSKLKGTISLNGKSEEIEFEFFQNNEFHQDYIMYIIMGSSFVGLMVILVLIIIIIVVIIKVTKKKNVRYYHVDDYDL